MRLHFLDPKSGAAINVTKLTRLGYEAKRIVAQTLRSLDALVVIGNGTPDDIVLGVLSYYLDGHRVVGLVKPEKTGPAVLDELKRYLQLSIKKFLVLIDQEDTQPNMIFNEAMRRMEIVGINVSVKEETNKLRVHQCSLAGRKFEVLVVVNGLEDVDTERHTIEDHLMKGLQMETKGSSKDSWNSLSRDKKKDFLRRLKDRPEVIEKLFPQQIAACKCLVSESNSY